MTTKFLVIPLITISLAFVSCGGNSESEKNSEGTSGSDSTLVADTVSVSMDDNEVSYNLPSALQIAYVFKKSGAGFVPSLFSTYGLTPRIPSGHVLIKKSIVKCEMGLYL